MKLQASHSQTDRGKLLKSPEEVGLSSVCGQSSASPALAKQSSSSGPQPVLLITWCVRVAGDGDTEDEQGDTTG